MVEVAPSGGKTPDQDLLTLFDRIAFGDHTDADLEELERLVERDPDVVDWYLRYVRLDIETEEILRTARVHGDLRNRLASANSGGKPSDRRVLVHSVVPFLAIAASIAIVLVFWPQPTSEPSQKGMAEGGPMDGAAVVVSVEMSEHRLAAIQEGEHLVCGDTIEFPQGQVTLEFSRRRGGDVVWPLQADA